VRGWFKRFAHKKTIPKVGFDEFRHQYKIQHGRVSRKIDENRVGRLISKADSESKRNKRLKQPDRKEKSVERACFHQNSVTPRRAPRQRRTHRRPDDRQGAPGRRRPTLRRRPGAAPPGAGYAPPVAGGAIALPSRLTDCASFSFLFFFFSFLRFVLVSDRRFHFCLGYGPGYCVCFVYNHILARVKQQRVQSIAPSYGFISSGSVVCWPLFLMGTRTFDSTFAFMPRVWRLRKFSVDNFFDAIR